MKKKDFPIEIHELKLNSDDRGFLTEVLKSKLLPEPIAQINYTETYPGVIKAFHWHKYQFDAWFCVKGEIQVVLFDLREKNVPKQKATHVYFLGEKNPYLLIIPPRVAHGYKVLGNEKAGLLYAVTREYNPNNPDEERIPFDSPEIGFDWTTKNR